MRRRRREGDPKHRPGEEAEAEAEAEDEGVGMAQRRGKAVEAEPATPIRPRAEVAGSPGSEPNRFMTKTAKKRMAAKKKRATSAMEALAFLRRQQGRLRGLPLPAPTFDKQSFTCPAPAVGEPGAMMRDQPSSIGVVLSSRSFYVSRARVPPELSTTIQACQGESHERGCACVFGI